MTKSSTIRPSKVFPLSSWMGLPWRYRKFCETWPRTMTALLVVLLVGWVGLICWAISPGISLSLVARLMISFSILGLVLLFLGGVALEIPDPIDEIDAYMISDALKKCPQFEDVVAKWISEGPLDQRHRKSLTHAQWKEESRAKSEAVSSTSDRNQPVLLSPDQVKSFLCGENERLASKIQVATLDKNTAPALSPVRRPPRL